jgi:hypothetical protein
MGSTYVIGQEVTLDPTTPRFFYGLRRTDDGELYFVRTDILNPSESIVINNEGSVDQDFQDFVWGQDFFEGRDVFHNKVYDNLKYEQYRWDNKDLYYYLDSNGNLTIRIGQTYTYPDPQNA